MDKNAASLLVLAIFVMGWLISYVAARSLFKHSGSKLARLEESILSENANAVVLRRETVSALYLIWGVHFIWLVLTAVFLGLVLTGPEDLEFAGSMQVALYIAGGFTLASIGCSWLATFEYGYTVTVLNDQGVRQLKRGIAGFQQSDSLLWSEIEEYKITREQLPSLVLRSNGRSLTVFADCTNFDTLNKILAERGTKDNSNDGSFAISTSTNYGEKELKLWYTRLLSKAAFIIGFIGVPASLVGYIYADLFLDVNDGGLGYNLLAFSIIFGSTSFLSIMLGIISRRECRKIAPHDRLWGKHERPIRSRGEIQRVWKTRYIPAIAIVLVVTLFFAYINLNPLNDNNIELTIYPIANDTTLTPEPGFQYVIISGTIFDSSGKRGSMPLEYVLKTDAGREYHYDSNLTLNIPSHMSSDKHLFFKIGYKIPVGETPVSLAFYHGIYVTRAPVPQSIY